MASGFYNLALAEIGKALIDLDGDTLKVMIVDSTYVYDPDHTVVDNGGNNATDPSFCELVATNYAGGYGGAGRKVATITGQANNTDNRADFALADLVWTALGGAVNGTIGGLILIKEITADVSSRLIAFFDVTDLPTNGVT